MSEFKKVNRFSKRYFLYPELMKEKEEKYNKYLKKEKENYLKEQKSKKALIKRLEKSNKKNLKELFLANGFDINDLPKSAEWMPIEIFDNKKYELRTPKEWMEFYSDKNGQIEINGKALLKREGKYVWEKIKVLNYDKESKKWNIQDSEGKKHLIPRINLFFDSENQNIYVIRFIKAYLDRIYQNSTMKYTFYVKSMPTHDIKEISKKSKNNILFKAFDLKKINNVNIISPNELEKFIDDFYFINYNKIIFDNHIKKNPDNFVEKNELFISEDLIKKKKVPKKGLIKLRRNAINVEPKNKNFVYPPSMDFEEHFKLFCVKSIYTKKSILNILKEVKEINWKMSQSNIFNLKIKNCLTYNTFKKLQENSTSSFLSSSRSNWGKKVIGIIIRYLENENKGWLNLKDINMENYHLGKLKGILSRVDIEISDCIKKIVKKDFTKYVQFILKYVPDKVKIVSENSIKTYYKNKIVNQDMFNDFVNDNKPLFFINNRFHEDKIGFSQNPENFLEIILLIFKKTLNELCKFRKIEDQIVNKNMESKLQKNIKVPILPTRRPDAPSKDSIPKKYENENLWLWELYNELKEGFQKAIDPLKEYKKFYSSLNEFLFIDSNAFIKSFSDKDKYSVQDLINEIEKLNEKENEILDKFKEELQISCFKINQTEIREKTKALTKKLKKGIIGLIKNKGHDLLNGIIKNQKTLKNKLKEKPNNIEDLSALKDYLNNQLNVEVDKIKKKILELQSLNKKLEDKSIMTSSEDIKKFWYVFGVPKEIKELKYNLIKDLNHLTNDLFKDMKKKQIRFEDDIVNIENSIKTFVTQYDIKKYSYIFDEANDINHNLQLIIEKSNKFNSREQLFGKISSDYSKIFKLDKNFKPFYDLWRIIQIWFTEKFNWIKKDWKSVDAIYAENFMKEGLRVMTTVIGSLRNKPKEFADLIKNSENVKDELLEFNKKVPLLVALKKEGMKKRHWDEISEKTKIKIDPETEKNFNFQLILDKGLLNHKNLCISIGDKACKEYTIEKSLEAMYEKWSKLEVETIKYKKTTGFILKGFDKIDQELDEDFSMTGAMLINPFKGPFETDIENWNNNLLLVSNVVDEWRRLQAQWAYLQPIFDSNDIARQLPKENSMFKQVDNFYKELLNNAKNIKVLKLICEEDKEILEKMKKSNQELEEIQNELNNYLEIKRSKFSRFYFLSNDELLSILSETKEVERIQEHLRKVFENIKKLRFDEKKVITSMYSVEGEKIDFVKKINPKGKQVEDWMIKVEEQMKASVKKALLESITDYKTKKRYEWIFDHPGQCVLNGSQMQWTYDVEEAIEKNTLKELLEKMNQNLLDIVKLDRQKFSIQQAISVEALIVLDVHAIEVVEKLIKEEVKNINAFEWISQLRYYILENDCFIKCIQTVFPYGYEYLGNTGRLVITPLTDKCYMTLMGAIQLNLGGAPAGPAGTGKTETTKDLAKALAKQCVVFNCQESMDYQFVAKFFKGLASSGAWCCFDEFNRINIEVLSVIAQQLQELFRAKSENRSELRFEGTMIKVQPTFSVFITMNPGYAGRSELPQNLSALFRPIAMMVPNYALIGKIKLFSYGFTKAEELAKKMVVTFKLSSEQLSNQKHYDYGMRAVTSVINAAGLFKRTHKDSDLNEEQLLLKALKDVNIPKFLSKDLPLFENIIKDLFPDVKQHNQQNLNLNNFILETCEEFKIQPKKQFLLKINQLYDTLQVRHGLMIVGKTGGGKTTNYNVLQHSLNKLSKKDEKVKSVEVDIINPKTLNLEELYGISKDLSWQEGIIEITVERVIKDHRPVDHWIMFDGPVDAIWIESMNTVLDDNKKLCLSSGKVLMVSDNVKMMFEVENLLVASPATVSRCGMVYMEPESMGTKHLLESYFSKLPNKFRENEKFVSLYNNLINDVLYPSFETANSMKCIFETNDVTMMSGFIKMFDCMIAEGKKKNTLKEIELITSNLEKIFTFSILWSIGSNFENIERDRFQKYLRIYLEDFYVDLPTDNLFDYEYNFKNHNWNLWSQSFENKDIEMGLLYHEIVIPSKYVASGLSLTKLLLTNGHNVLTPGVVGTGKTTNAVKLLSENLDKNYTSISITLSAQTTSNQILNTIFSQIDKRKKGVWGPAHQKKCVLFIDDLNMPRKEIWGAQPPLELLRQYCDHSSWYVFKLNKAYIKVEDIVILASMVPPGTGRNDISKRLSRHFNYLGYTEFDDETTKNIFNKITDYFLSRFDDDIRSKLGNIVNASLEIYKNVRNNLLPTPAKSHYLFNLRDLSKVFQGISLADPKYIKSYKDLITLWYHENQRIYEDRLICSDDINIIENIIQNSLEKNIHIKINNQDLLFTTITNEKNKKIGYKQILDQEKFIKKIDRYLEDYNISVVPKKQMKLVMFKEACFYIAKICRVLNSPQGHVLLLGVGGSGRQSLSRLSSYILNLQTFQIEVTKSYNLAKWREDLKNLIYNTIMDDINYTFIINDTQIIDESMVEDVNCLLNSGNVVDLPYNPDEIKNLEDFSRKECMRKGVIPNKINILNCKVGKVKKNLHLVLALSPMAKEFNIRLRMFPALVNNCSLNWMTKWPEEALIGVAHQKLNPNFEEFNQRISFKKMKEMFKFMHKYIEKISVKYDKEMKRKNYLTPKSYLELLNIYQKLLKQKDEELNNKLNRLSEGLQKLINANSEVKNLRIKLKDQEPKLKQAEILVKDLLEKVKEDKIKENETKKNVAKEEAEAAKQQIEANILKAKAEDTVKVANDQLEKTLEKIQLLKPANIVEIRSVNVPVKKVKLVIMCMCYFLVDKSLIKKKMTEDDFWTLGRNNLLNDPNKLFKTFTDPETKNNIKMSDIVKVRGLIKKNEEIWTDKEMKNSSLANYYLYLWVDCIINFTEINEKTKPVRDELQRVTKILNEKTEFLAIKKKQLDNSMKRLKELEDLYNEKINFKEDLFRQIKECNLKLERANKLTTLLADEKERWSLEIERFKQDKLLIPSNCLFISGMIAYSGPFIMEYRRKISFNFLKKMKELGLEYSENLSMINFLANPLDIMNWNLKGLPKDETSVQNGIIIDNTTRWPLIIDPQNRANKFLKNLGKEFRIKSVKANSDILQAIETEVQFGSWVLVENVSETLDPALDSILSPKISMINGRKHINLGDRSFPYNDSFRFFMTTSLPNPHYSPEISAKASIINFGITRKGLEEQLLAQIMLVENKELENQKAEIVKQNSEDQKKLVEIEDNILKSLKNSSGDILMDETLIIKLVESKKTSSDINEKIKISIETEKNIDITRENYRDLAYHSSLLFFCIMRLSIIDPMYQYSLQWFENIFESSLNQSKKSSHLETRINNIKDFFTYSLYKNVCQSLFVKDKLLFSFLLNIKLIDGYNKLNKEKYQLFLTGNAHEGKIPKKLIDYIPENSWKYIYSELKAIDNLNGLNGILDHFLKNPEEWKKIYNSTKPHELELPEVENVEYTDMDRLLLIKALRRDKLIQEIQRFIIGRLGEKYVEVPIFKLNEIYKNSNSSTPLIFIISAGSDPKTDFDALAFDLEIKNIHSISLGQGQEDRSYKMIKELSKPNGSGGWILLQNCHLLLSWMSKLESICENLSPETTHPDFRLWLTSMPCKEFPTSILQNSSKMTLEPPSGLKANLKLSYNNLDDKALNACETKSDVFKKLLYGLCFFHAVVQERTKFGPIGWNIPYAFTNEDLGVCKKQLKLFLDEYDKVPYKVLNFICAQINYGGRVTDAIDKRLIETLLKNFINPEVLKDDYKFSKNGEFSSVKTGNQADYLKYIQTISLNPSPEIFGLHDNAEIITNQNMSMNMLKTILDCEPQKVSMDIGQGDNMILQILTKIEKRIPDNFNIENIKKKFPTLYEESLNTVLLQETEKYNWLLKKMKKDIDDLKKVVKGFVVLNTELELILDFIYKQKVPVVWGDIFLSEKPLFSWIEDLNLRINFFRDWINNQKPNIFWFPGFSFPQAFITGITQNYARQKKIEINRIGFELKFLDENIDIKNLKQPEVGAYVSGLFIEGAKWNNKSQYIVEPTPKELFSKLPILWLIPKEDVEAKSEGFYKCPLYKVVSRHGTLSTTGHSTNFVMFLDLPTQEKSDHWIKAGVAAFLSLKY